MSDHGLTYEQSGVTDTAGALHGLLGWVNRTLAFRKGGAGDSLLEIGFYANVLDLGHDIGLAISTDGVGTKILVAEMMGRYDTIGIDCVAMNVNDLICVGAEPLAMLDYLAVEKAEPAVMEQIGKGLYAGAAEANISIPGGEMAQLGSMIRGLKPGSGLDLVGTCVGLVMRGGRILMGQAIEAGDLVVGMASSGIHSNGLTLAREALFNRGNLNVDSRPAPLGQSLGEELLTPTRIYVRPALEMIRNLPGLRALAHITSDGFLNLLRIPGAFGYQIETLPPTPPIFNLIQETGRISMAEMYRVYNMGIGMCAIVDASEADDLLGICRTHRLPASLIGRVTAGSREVTLPSIGLRGSGDHFDSI